MRGQRHTENSIGLSARHIGCSDSDSLEKSSGLQRFDVNQITSIDDSRTPLQFGESGHKTSTNIRKRKFQTHEEEELIGNLAPTKKTKRRSVQDAMRPNDTEYVHAANLKHRASPIASGLRGFQSNNVSYGGYTNLRGQHASGQGTINNIHHETIHRSPVNPLNELEKCCSHSASFDSGARFDPPRCAESTRLHIIRIIEDWINGDEDPKVPSSLFWLNGGAGVGKSALAQSLSERFHKKKELAASFFFLRSDPTRNNGDALIPTLVSHLVHTFQGLAPHVEGSISRNTALFTKRYEVQIQELLLDPLLQLHLETTISHPPKLVVIDGLDECQDPDVQLELLHVIARAIRHIPYPLRFLVASRPEAHITEMFNHDPDLQATKVHHYNLSNDPDADMDIHKFLETEFAEIRRVHRLRQHLPPIWPDPKSVMSLVERSSGHFIYASTVIKYIKSSKHRPDDRLEVILRLLPPQEGDRPYARLDALYDLIFEGVEDVKQLEKICLVLGMLYLRTQPVGFYRGLAHVSTTIEKLLWMKPGDLILLFDPVLSLVAIDGENLRILHKSLIDYLLDPDRGGHLPFDVARVHGMAATFILEQRIARMSCSINEYRDFAYHCQYASLNDVITKYLHSLEVPYPASVVMANPMWDDERNETLRSIIWFFLRTLSREDLDPTRILYEKYVHKWMAYLGPAIPQASEHHSRVAVSETVYGLQCNLDTVLTVWKPTSIKFAQAEPGLESDKYLAYIRKEHEVFSAFAKKSFPNETNALASSLVLGCDYMHSYDFGFVNGKASLSLRTYAKHNRTCYQTVFTGSSADIAKETFNYLWSLEKYLFSDRYQTHGLEPI